MKIRTMPAGISPTTFASAPTCTWNISACRTFIQVAERTYQSQGSRDIERDDPGRTNCGQDRLAFCAAGNEGRESWLGQFFRAVAGSQPPRSQRWFRLEPLARSVQLSLAPRIRRGRTSTRIT